MNLCLKFPLLSTKEHYAQFNLAPYLLFPTLRKGTIIQLVIQVTKLKFLILFYFFIFHIPQNKLYRFAFNTYVSGILLFHLCFIIISYHLTFTLNPRLKAEEIGYRETKWRVALINQTKGRQSTY